MTINAAWFTSERTPTTASKAASPPRRSRRVRRVVLSADGCKASHRPEASSARHWARELIKLGHDARMMPPAYVKPYIRRQKNDAADAAAICEAVTRPSMRFVGVRSLENQAALMRHKARRCWSLSERNC